MARTTFHWTARISCAENELTTNVSFLIFFGPVPEGLDDPRTSPDYVGSWDTFFDDLAAGALDSGDKKSTVIQSFVNLSRAIVKRLGSKGLQPDVAEPFLKEKLSWCIIRQSDNGRIDLNEVPSLEVVVLAIPMTDTGNGPPRKSGPPQERPDITKGKEGGYRDHEDKEIRAAA